MHISKPGRRPVPGFPTDYLKAIIEKQSDEDWSQSISTKEFGTKTKAEALGRIISHTTYHAGQLALTLKYAS